MRNKGFTLLELSIVIVIIGLIVAGISAGQSLVKQAHLRSIGSELANLRTAINGFKLQYDTLPGDMSNAHDYWGATCDATPANCNGDGNGTIITSTLLADVENLRSMQHMALAGLIDKQFSFPSVECNDTTCPASSFPLGFYTFRGGDGQIYGGENTIIFGATRPSSALPITVLLTPTELQSIDSKVDDSIAGTGQIKGWAGRNTANTAWVNDCVTPDNCDRNQLGASCNYDLDVTTQQCAILASP